MELINSVLFRVKARDEQHIAVVRVPWDGGNLSMKGELLEEEMNSVYAGIGLGDMVLATRTDDGKIQYHAHHTVSTPDCPVHTLPFQTICDIMNEIVYHKYLEEAKEIWPGVQGGAMTQ